MDDIVVTGRVRLVVVPAEVLAEVGAAQDASSEGPVSWPGVGPISPELWAGLPARMRLDQLAEDPSLARWLVRGIVVDHDGTTEVIGHLGGHGAPGEDGSVEIGYTVATEHRGQGTATASARAWFGWAFEQGATRARLSTLPDNRPSRAIADRLGFAETGREWDEDDQAWEVVFERPLPLDPTP